MASPAKSVNPSRLSRRIISVCVVVGDRKCPSRIGEFFYCDRKFDIPITANAHPTEYVLVYNLPDNDLFSWRSEGIWICAALNLSVISRAVPEGNRYTH